MKAALKKEIRERLKKLNFVIKKDRMWTQLCGKDTWSAKRFSDNQHVASFFITLQVVDNVCGVAACKRVFNKSGKQSIEWLAREEPVLAFLNKLETGTLEALTEEQCKGETS